MAASVAGGAPAWVYVLLVVLIVLGVRRLRTREVPMAVALMPSIAFLIWSVVGVIAFARWGGPVMAVSSWIAGAAFGAVTAWLIQEPRGERLADGRVRLPGTVLPLILYMAVFAARFAMGAWAAMQPANAATATALSIAIGAAMTARLVIAVLRWRPSPAL